MYSSIYHLVLLLIMKRPDNHKNIFTVYKSYLSSCKGNQHSSGRINAEQPQVPMEFLRMWRPSWTGYHLPLPPRVVFRVDTQRSSPGPRSDGSDIRACTVLDVLLQDTSRDVFGRGFSERATCSKHLRGS